MIIPLHHALLQLLHWSVPTTPDHTPWSSPCHIRCYSESPSHNAPPQPWGTWSPSEITWSSCDDHTTMCHLIGRPSSQQTWDLRVPTLFSSNLFLSYCVLMLLICSTVSAGIPGLDPNLEANCMHPCILFTSLSPPPCGQPP